MVMREDSFLREFEASLVGKWEDAKEIKEIKEEKEKEYERWKDITSRELIVNNSGKWAEIPNINVTITPTGRKNHVDVGFHGVSNISNASNVSKNVLKNENGRGKGLSHMKSNSHSECSKSPNGNGSVSVSPHSKSRSNFKCLFQV